MTENKDFFSEEILWELFDSIKKGNIMIMGILEREGREKGAERLFKEIVEYG